MGRVLRIFGVLAVAVVAGLAFVWISMRPPAPLAMPEAGATLSGVTVINPGVDRREGQRVLVVGDAIRSITTDAAPEGPYVGAFVLPGLIDLHAHLPPASPLGDGAFFPFLFLYHGVTTIRNAGDVDGTADGAVRSGVDAGRFPAPRLFSCGPFIDGTGRVWRNTRTLVDPSEAAALVESLAGKVDCIKAYNTLTPDVAEALHAAAKARGIPVIGHVPQGSRFVDAHLDDAQHMMGMAFPEGPENPFPQSMGKWPQLADADLREIARTAARKGKAVTPTLVVIDRLSRADDHAALSALPEAQLLPRLYRDVVWRPRTDLTPAHFAGIRAALPVEQRLVRMLYDAGARLHIGTDPLVFFVVPGAGLYREMRLFAEAGIPLEQTWRIATSGNAGALPLEGLGRLTRGAPADLLVFRSDPTRDLAALDSLEAVVSQGRLYTREQLEAQAEAYRAYADGVVFDTLSVAIARRLLGRLN